MTGKRVHFITYGCQMNFADKERMAGALREAGYEETGEVADADLVVLNTCAVRASAEDKAFGKIGELKHAKERNPRLILGVTGCMAQEQGDALIRRAPHLDFVLGTGKIGELVPVVMEIERERGHIVRTALGAAAWKRQAAEDGADGVAHGAAAQDETDGVASILRAEEGTALPVREGKFSAWVPIMYGCNNFCTYCIVPYVRGRERSRAPEDILREVREAAAAGYREVTLLGQNVNSYGRDHQQADFSDLLAMVDEVPGIERVRFMTSHPKDLSDKLIETIKNGRHICEHIHLPVQHGSDRMLKKMNRVYTAAHYKELVRKIRAAIPGVALTTDLIVGFPGETEEDFAALLDFVREIRYDAAFTFLYSPRAGTPAARMADQVDAATKHARLEKLMAVQNAISLEINEALQGETVEVLVEGPSKHNADVYSGRTRTNKLVLFPHAKEAPGDLVTVKITQPQTFLLKGELV